MFSNQKFKVLVVDDAATVRQIIVSTLKDIGFTQNHIREARDGLAAIEALKADAADLIISDWNMPHMDGFALLKTVKQHELWKQIPFLMITSETEEAKKTEAFHSGADQYITKPFTPNILEKTVSALLHKNEVFAGKHVLVVDDSAPIRHVVRKNLAQAGFAEMSIYTAGDGEEALQILGQEKIHLVLTDWHMPKIDGLELVKRMKAAPELKHIPVIMLTSETEKEKIITALQAGLMGYIIKPFNAIDLQNKIQQVFAAHASH